MIETPAHPFGSLAPLLRSLGYWPRPVKFGTKIPALSKWQMSDPEIRSGVLQSWLETYADYGIGIVTGSPFPDGTLLGALDIDRDDYVETVQALLRQPVCGRVGAKGAVFPVRIRGDGKYRQFAVKTADGRTTKVGELLCERRFCVLPPTIHPSTKAPYRWIGTPLHEVAYSDLPLIEA